MSVCVLLLILQDALSSYENDRVRGCLHTDQPSNGNGNGSGASGGGGALATQLQSYIQFGEKFKAYPTCVSHCYLPELMNVIKFKCDVYKHILNVDPSYIQSATMKFALAVKVFVYPNNVCATWLIIGQISKEEE